MRITLDADQFLREYRARSSSLRSGTEADLRRVLHLLATEDRLDSVEQAAYVLATIRHETAHTWRPLEEVGRGEGREYGESCVLSRGERRTYYGRGYVQLTWLQNYARMSVLLQLDLVSRPELLLESAVSWNVLVLGMTGGVFTGRRLSEFVAPAEGRLDYVQARRVVNALDQAERIAADAAKLEACLRASLMP
jgi:hypothetical protein